MPWCWAELGWGRCALPPFTPGYTIRSHAELVYNCIQLNLPFFPRVPLAIVALVKAALHCCPWAPGLGSVQPGAGLVGNPLGWLAFVLSTLQGDHGVERPDFTQTESEGEDQGYPGIITPIYARPADLQRRHIFTAQHGRVRVALRAPPRVPCPMPHAARTDTDSDTAQPGRVSYSRYASG